MATGPSKVGTIDPNDTTERVFVDENLKEVGAGSTSAAFVYRRSDLARVVARRKALGLPTGDEAVRVQRESHKKALEDAERDAQAANDRVELLRARVEASDARAEADEKPKRGAKAES
jgi:hypothetical protein